MRAGRSMKGVKGTRASAHLFPIKEDSREMRSFEAAVRGLLDAGELWVPRPDTPKRVVTDASNHAVGAVTFQL